MGALRVVFADDNYLVREGVRRLLERGRLAEADDLVLMAYGALSLQTTQFSLADPAGVLNPEAARWFQANPTHIPLTREPFRLIKEET